jgi:DNA-binding transcriptional regulator YdaS (Cro superfamily)
METALKLKIWRGNRKAEYVAAMLGVTLAMWSRWETGKRPIPAARVLEIEALTGVSRHDLRPDVFGPSKASAA